MRERPVRREVSEPSYGFEGAAAARQRALEKQRGVLLEANTENGLPEDDRQYVTEEVYKPEEAGIAPERQLSGPSPETAVEPRRRLTDIIAGRERKISETIKKVA